MIVAENPGIKIIGEAKNGKELLQLARQLKPEIIITDIMMPGMSGIELTKILTKELHGIGIIGLSVFDNESHIIDMLQAGAKGYLLKSDPVDEFVNAIKAVNKDDTYFSRSIIKTITNSIVSGNYANDKIRFSDKEVSVIKLICQDLSNKEIAKALDIGTRTVEWYREKLLQKTDSKGTAGIVLFAIRNNIFPLG